jgi:hypothetical protein
LACDGAEFGLAKSSYISAFGKYCLRRRFVEFLGQLSRSLDEGCDDALGVFVFDLGQHDKPRMALD